MGDIVYMFFKHSRWNIMAFQIFQIVPVLIVDIREKQSMEEVMPLRFFSFCLHDPFYYYLFFMKLLHPRGHVRSANIKCYQRISNDSYIHVYS